MQGTQRATRASEEERTLEYPRQASGELEETERVIFATEETMQEEVKEAEAAVDACYWRRARRAGLGGMLPMGRPMTEGKLDNLSEQLGDGLGARARRREEVERMSLAEMEAELRGVQEEIRRRRNVGAGWLPLMLMLLCISGHPAEGFTAYDCSNRSNIVESSSLLEPDACANMGKEGEVETTVYGEIVQIKQDRMIPVFRCIVIETIISQYCGMFSAAGIARYIRLREPRTLEAWECRQARKSGKIVINGRTFQGKIGATALHSMLLAGGLDDESRCEIGIVTFPDGKTLNSQAAQGLYEITLREEFARLNELTGSLTLTSGVQATAGDKSIVDSLEGTVGWEYDSMACSLITIFGRGHLAIKAGGAVYITSCAPVEVLPRSRKNCTEEIPVTINGMEAFVDPISYVIKSARSPVHCNDIPPPPRYKVGGKWYCSYPDLRECHDPAMLPVDEVKIDPVTVNNIGLGKSIYTKEQLEEFAKFQDSQGTRKAHLAETAELACMGRNEKGEWGLALRSAAQVSLVDLVGMNFFPLYKVVGLMIFLLSLLLMVWGGLRHVVTIFLRVAIIVRYRGCGVWVLTAF
jgi:hypothetical protein